MAAIISNASPNDECVLLKDEIEYYKTYSNSDNPLIDINLIERMSIVSDQKEKLRDLMYNYNQTKMNKFLEKSENLILFENFLFMLDESVSGIRTRDHIRTHIQKYYTRLDQENVTENEKILLTKTLADLQNNYVNFNTSQIDFYRNFIKKVLKSTSALLKEKLAGKK